MSNTLQRFRKDGEHAGTEYEVVVEQWDQKAFTLAEVNVDGLPSRSDSDHGYSSLDEAFDAGDALARHLIDS